MMEIRSLRGRTAYLDGAQLIGLYLLDDRHCILLDTGPASIRTELEESLSHAGLTPVGVLCTHTHFDHFGNAAWFQKQCGIPVALPFGEAELCRTFPTLKSYLFVYSAGEVMSDPQLRELPCLVDRVIHSHEDTIDFLGARFRILRTPGHSPEHISILTPDRVCYTGDALICGAALTHAKLPYAYNLRQSMESLEQFRDLDCDTLLVAHKGIVDAPFGDLLDENRRIMTQQLQTVAAIIDRRMSLEEIFTAVRETMHIRVDTPRKAENMERFLRPYLECLIDDGTHRLALRGSGTLCYEPV